MTKQEARQILASWLESSKGTEEQLGYIEGWFDKKDEEAFCMAIEALQKQTVYEQVKWERDMALQTLEEHGIGLGQKSDWIPDKESDSE